MIDFEDSGFARYAASLGDGDAVQEFPAHLDRVRALIASLDDVRAAYRYAPGKWSVRELIGHMADTHAIFSYRLLCFARGERKSLPGFDEGPYVENARFDELPFAAVAAHWLGAASASSALAGTVQGGAWDREGIANGTRITPRQMLSALIGHERHHLGVLQERYAIG